MIKTLISDGNLTWLSTFFLDGDYPLLLQLSVVNGLAVIIYFVMQAIGRANVRHQHTSRTLFWMIISANVFLVMNKDYRFIGFLA